MKWNYLCLLMLAFTFVISGCGDDDEDNSSTDLVGTWEIVDFDYDGTSTTTAGGFTTTTDFVGTGLNLDYTLIFNEDGTYSADGGYDIELVSTTEFQGTSSTTEQIVPITDLMGSGEYSVSGNTIITMGGFFSFDASGMNSSGQNEESMTDFTLNGDLLTFESESEATSSQAGAVATSTTRSVVVLERQ